MPHYLRILAFSFLANSFWGITGCGNKSSDPQAQAQKATLTGQIQPVASITLITATNDAGVSVTSAPTSSGSYSFPGLVLGSYILTFTPATGYVMPAPQPVTLMLGGTTVVPITVLEALATASYTVDGATVTSTFFNIFKGLGEDSYGFLTSREGGPGNSVNFYFSNTPITVGTHSLTSPQVNARYISPNLDVYATDQSPSGSITILSATTLPRRMSGTFSFIALKVGPTGTAAPKTITNGTFTNIPY